ncbi:DUF6371 domain-containing protein [Epilithonimonas hominis]|uniref:DUF6371 domain-containing protein n=1 Tax=Epilithonimonas hominis TaxID=420404 RepID=UPI00289C7845|nr:DUF6371 domain-containing protein [Epilithonimonas hominis]
MKTINYRYQLDKSSKKFRCPACGKDKKFKKFVDAEGNYQSDVFGKCDRVNSCNYYKYPTTEENFTPRPLPKQRRKPQIYFPEDVFVKTLKDANMSDFYRNLKHLGIQEEEVMETFKAYKIGALTKGKFKGAVIFPYIDHYNKIHSVQVKMFDEKNKTTDQNWLHSILYYHYKNTGNVPKWLTDYFNNDRKTNCLFGEHLINSNDKDIIIVESPKNAIYGALFFTEFLWLASGSLTTLNVAKLLRLKGRKVLLVPDTSKDNVAYEIWEQIAQEAKAKGVNVKMFDFLENITNCEQKEQGFDIADLITAELTKPKAKRYEDYTREERLQCGLTAFADADLKKLAQRLFAEKKQMRWSALSERLQELESLQEQETEDLIDVLSIKKIIKYDTDTYLYSL